MTHGAIIAFGVKVILLHGACMSATFHAVGGVTVTAPPTSSAHAPPEVLRHETVNDGIGCALDEWQQVNHQLQQKMKSYLIILSQLFIQQIN